MGMNKRYTQKELFELFDQLNISYTNHEHEPVFTIEEGKGRFDHIPGAHCKTLFMKTKQGDYFLIVMLGDSRLDMKELSNRLSCGKLSFASPERLMEHLAITPGSVTPFALVHEQEKKITVILDDQMMEYDVLNYHPLRNDMTTTIAREGLVTFLDHVGHQYTVINLPVKEE